MSYVTLKENWKCSWVLSSLRTTLVYSMTSSGGLNPTRLLREVLRLESFDPDLNPFDVPLRVNVKQPLKKNLKASLNGDL